MKKKTGKKAKVSTKKKGSKPKKQMQEDLGTLALILLRHVKADRSVWEHQVHAICERWLPGSAVLANGEDHEASSDEP